MSNENVFNNKSDAYSEGRPSYAPKMISKLLCDILHENSIVADIGSGTGILTKEFVTRGYETYAVEPNGDMRKKAEASLSQYPCFHSVNALAEDTGLRDNSFSLVTAASSFHWFDVSRFKTECQRILDDDGVVCVISNVRIYDEFSEKQCEIIRKYCEHFESLTHGYNKTVNQISGFFEGKYDIYEYDFPLEYTKEKFISRCLSSSYSPLPNSSNYSSYISELEALIGETCKEDVLKIANKTVMFVGKVK